MKLPVGKITGKDLEDLFEKSILHHQDMLYKVFSDFEPEDLYNKWNLLVRSIDEIINIPFELKNTSEREVFLSLPFEFMNQENLPKLGAVLTMLQQRFGRDVALRFQKLATMCFAIDASYSTQGLFSNASDLRLNSVASAINFLQSRRLYYVTLLNLIPKIAKGTKTIDYVDTLNYFQYHIDHCMVNITSAYYNLLLNNCVANFEVVSDGKVITRNFNYDHLEGFFLEPQRLSLIDQLELRPDSIAYDRILPKAGQKIFSFSEVANAMALFEAAFGKYKVEEHKVFKELNLFMVDIAPYLEDDFNFTVDATAFEALSAKYKALVLHHANDNYLDNLNSFAPFQKSGSHYHSTVVLLVRFVTRAVYQSLLRNRTFQIHSGFIFEDRVKQILTSKGYKMTDFKRINRQEFDVITIKDGKVFNFQCKNNYIDISRVAYDYHTIGRVNKRLMNYYNKALMKESAREHLIASTTGISDIEHFVISRFPIIGENERIINFVDLASWTPKG